MEEPPKPTPLQTILRERGKTYGPFERHASISQAIKKAIFLYGYGMPIGLTPDQKEALEMIAHKIARIANGNPNHIDNWDDIAGYATLVADELRRVSDEAPTRAV